MAKWKYLPKLNARAGFKTAVALVCVSATGCVRLEAMSGTPKAAAKRHSARKRVPKNPELKTVRCKNCPVIFKQIKVNQMFHSKQCKDDFHHNGAGFGKLRDRLPRFVASEVKRAMIDVDARLSQVELKLLLVERKQSEAKPQAG
jgi:hypothetical protein